MRHGVLGLVDDGLLVANHGASRTASTSKKSVETAQLYVRHTHTYIYRKVKGAEFSIGGDFVKDIQVCFNQFQVRGGSGWTSDS